MLHSAAGRDRELFLRIIFQDVAYPVNISIILLKACATTNVSYAELPPHHVFKCWVCVCVRVSVTEAGRDLFMHNKSIWLIIKAVWNLFPF